MQCRRRLMMLAAVTFIALCWTSIGSVHASEGMGIKEAEALCNGERDATNDDIIRGCTRVIQYGPLFAKLKYAYINRAFAYRAKGQCELALADLNTAINMRANKPYVYRTRGSVFLCLKRYDDALADLNYVIEKDPKDAWAYFFRGQVHLQKGDRARAKADFDQAIRLDPEFGPRVVALTGG